MTTAQRVGLGLLYTGIAVLGAVYAVFEEHHANRLVHFMKELLPAFLIFVLLVIVYAFFRTAVGGVKELNGVSQAAHATLHMNYGKKLG